MELRHLRYFVAVAEEMNIHRAAKRLNIYQPPLSLSIKQLEEEIGAALFLREGRGIQITKAGEIFLKRAYQILESAQKASLEASHIEKGVAGTLRIGFVSSTVTGILQKFVSLQKQHYPNVELDLRQSTNSAIPQQLMARDIDIGILRLPEHLPDGVSMKEITKESWCVALYKNHPLISKKEIRIKDLKNEKLIFYPRSNTAAGYDDVMKLFHDKDVVPNIVQEATEQMTIAGLVASGMGLGIVPECMASIKIPNVTHRLLEGTKNRTGFACVFRKEKDILVNQFLNLSKLI